MTDELRAKVTELAKAYREAQGSQRIAREAAAVMTTAGLAEEEAVEAWYKILANLPRPDLRTVQCRR
jgi:predicted transcriptional regulator